VLCRVLATGVFDFSTMRLPFWDRVRPSVFSENPHSFLIFDGDTLLGDGDIGFGELHFDGFS